ncbi:CaiB/BaiF CoA transferase family protein [Ferrimonas balearica]|uniref:CaiB/BaiF CoA transferase family protein n=1 Tax=Ferrimonas balearica TaxID=44012 RepID=UPI001C98FF9D|nr:CaiB/BaiF CoA-transferase family protein [Ferrimonas balearica]MBY5921179.1 CoA transferase [Ferrimonas balearica]MBY5996136.1 CoA transferase [Ferrimonas balearica]
MGALSGLRVLDLSRVLAGPWAGQLLADLGAEVIKVERPGRGDDTRHWGPPFLEGPDGPPESAYFLCANRGKRSVCLDLSSPEDQQRCRELAQQCDVVIENFKVGDAARRGLDYPTLSADNPGLIYCSITGFGQTGPYRHRPGYDLLVQAMGGLMSITGEPDGEPQKVGVALTDIMTGLYATVGILAAVNERQRSGLGQHIDLALLDVTAATLANQATNALVGGLNPGRLGNAHPNIVPYQSFVCADGELVLAVGNDFQFGRLCELLGMAEWATDPRYATNAARVAHRSELVPALARAFLGAGRDHWLTQLEQAGIPAGPINSVQEVFADPQIQGREMVIALNHANGAEVLLPGNPIKLSRTPVEYAAAPPSLGQAVPEWLWPRSSS